MPCAIGTEFMSNTIITTIQEMIQFWIMLDLIPYYIGGEA